MKVEALPVIEGVYNLQDYDKTYQTFDWSQVEKEFSWHETGKLNAAYEAIDKHANSTRKIKLRFIIEMRSAMKNIHSKK